MTSSALPFPAQPDSLWFSEALAADQDPDPEPASGPVTADVCVIGGGYAGLWSAIELVEREPGISVVVLEADLCGRGASGRNVGLFSSSWHDLEGLCTTYGQKQGYRYAAAISDAMNTIELWCQDHGVDAHLRRGGIAYYGRPGDTWPRAAVQAAKRLGAEGRLELWDARRCEKESGAHRIGSAAYSRDAATIQPALLARGLRRVARELGVRVFECSRVRRIETGSRSIVRAGATAVACDRVVLTIGAWAAGWKGYRTRLANVCEVVLATEPIPERIEELGWATDVALVGGRQLIYGVRKTVDQRIVIGGGDFGVLYGGRIGRNLTHNRRIAEASAFGMRDLWPYLDGVRFTHAWGGAMDMTPTFAPFVSRGAGGKVIAALGFSGHGLAATRVAGRSVASLVLGADDEWSNLCVVGDPIARTPPEPLRWPAVWLALRASVATDVALESGAKPRRVPQLLGKAPLVQRNLIRAPGAGKRARGGRR